MNKDKIYELRIEEDDDLSGIDSISLVSEPAIEVNWLAFNKEKSHEFHIPEGEDSKYLSFFNEKGESEEQLFSQGWERVKEDFITSSPNLPSFDDSANYLIRYKYVLNPEAPGSPIKSTTREFCSDLLNKNLVYRVEDMDAIVNDEGDSALVWRGGYNCRHKWQKIRYHKNVDIVNNGSVREGRVDGDVSYDVIGYPQPDTRTSNPSFSKQGYELDYENDLPIFVDEGIRKVKCKECDWEWELSDGGDKPYKCNKCGYDASIEKDDMSKQKFAIDSDEKRIVVGPAMVPDLLIPRVTKTGEKYNVFFKSDTIRMISEKYMRNKYTDNNDLDHNGKAAEDVFVIESWIKEDNQDKSNKYGFNDLPVGTWFVSMKVRNNEVWTKIKNKELNGYSVSGFFEEVAQFCREEMFLKEVVKILESIKD